MRIVLVVTNSRRKNLVFSADTLKAYTLNEAVELAKRRALESVHSVKTGRGSYLRANPNPSDKNLSRENVGAVTRRYLYDYVVQPKHSIYFAAARMREIIDQWSGKIDLSDRLEIIFTLYHQKPRTPNLTPGPDKRGLQIQKEFLPLAESILTE